MSIFVDNIYIHLYKRVQHHNSAIIIYQARTKREYMFVAGGAIADGVIEYWYYL